VTSFRELNPPPGRVVEVYAHMMREQIVPALRELGFVGPARALMYGRENRRGTLRFQKDGRAVRAQLMRFTANVNYIAGFGRIYELMPVPTLDTWWEVKGGQPTADIAEAVVDVMRRYLVPAIDAALDDLADPPHDLEVDETGGFESFDKFEDAAQLVIDAPTDPGTVPALIDLTRHDPDAEARKLVASRVLQVFPRDPRVIAALQAAAESDDSYRVRWAARYALRLSRAGA